MRRVFLGGVGFGLVLGLAGALAPVAGPAAPAPPSLVDGDAVLRSCLLSPPPGYVASPQQHQPQAPPFPLSPVERARLLFPYAPELAGRTMGWTRSDRDYTESIPLEAKLVPRDLAGLPVLRFNNLEIHGERELRWRAHGDWDQWLLRDVTRKFDAVMAIHRETRRVYFFEYHWQGGRPVYDRSTESCYSCHASGPRLVRTYALEKTDAALLAEVNRRLLAYGAAHFGDSIDPARLGPALDDRRCAACHDGRTRGRLYAMHLPSVAFYLRTLRTMPPGTPLPPDEAEALISRHYERYQSSKSDFGSN